MPQKRRRKHRGTQAGTVRGARARPGCRAGMGGRAEQRRQQKLNEPPTWRGAITRGAIAAVSLFALAVLLLGAEPVSAIGLSLLAAVIYIPGFHAVDSFMYRRRQAKRDETA
jgi:hypothetical protein